MSLRIVRASILAEQDDALHEARLLLLLLHRADAGTGSIDGIMKLAKMDFLLRYPLYFQRLLNRIRVRPPSVPMREYEGNTVESKMVRFRYGPWDSRYRRWIGLLVAKGLAETFLTGKTVYVRITTSGRIVGEAIALSEEFTDLSERSRLVNLAVGSMSGTRLKELVYEVVPELTGMPWGKEIGL